MEPTGVIAEAQQMRPRPSRAQDFFATNGTSTANKVILQTLIARRKNAARPQRTRACTTALYCRAHNRSTRSSLNRKYGVFGPGRAHDSQSDRRTSDAQLLVLTSCTYDGLRMT